MPASRSLFSATGFVLVYLGAVNAIFAAGTGMCTQGAADLRGGIISLVAYSMALGCISYGKPERWWFVLLVPVLPVLAWQSWISQRLFFGYLVQGRSACDILNGTNGQMMDGGETVDVIIWVSMTLGIWFGLALNFWGRKRPAL